jgi:hypothetical protein
VTRSIGRCDQQRVPSLYTESTVRQSGASQVRPSSNRGTGGPSSGDSVRTEVGSNSTDSCIGYLPFFPFFGPFLLDGRIPEKHLTQTHVGGCDGAGSGVRAKRTRGDCIEQGLPRRENAMPQQAWSEKRERQYEHIKESLREQGRSEDTAEEIAARTVNKERARSGEARTASRTSVEDLSSGRRGGLRSRQGPGGRTYRQLYEEAKDRGIDGRSRMSKAQLERAVGRRS